MSTLSDILHLFNLAIQICIATLIINYITQRDTQKIPYRNTEPAIEEKNIKFRILDPLNTKKYPLEDDYEKLIDIKFKFKTNPQPCHDYDAGLLLVTIVASSPANFDKRVAIRKTWGRNTDYMKLVFLIGETKPAISKRIKTEISTYGDIVQGDFKDAYRNLTYKHIMGLKWVSHHCATAKYILKTDDDVFVNMLELKRTLVWELGPWGAEDMILCTVGEHAKVQRRPGKWHVTKKEFPDEYYPPYCIGPKIIYSQNVVRKLLNESRSTQYFWIDDVYVTGILTKNLDIAPTNMDMFLYKNETDTLIAKGPRSMRRFLFGAYDLSVDKILRMWKTMTSDYKTYPKRMQVVEWT